MSTPSDNSPPTPPVSSSSPTSPLQPPAGRETSGLPPNIAAGLACIFSIAGGIVFLLVEKKNGLVRFYAMQSILLGAFSIVVGIGFSVLGFIFAHVPFLGVIVLIALGLLHWLVAIGILVADIMIIVKAFCGVEWEIPYIGKFARRQLRPF